MPGTSIGKPARNADLPGKDAACDPAAGAASATSSIMRDHGRSFERRFSQTNGPALRRLWCERTLIGRPNGLPSGGNDDASRRLNSFMVDIGVGFCGIVLYRAIKQGIILKMPLPGYGTPSPCPPAHPKPPSDNGRIILAVGAAVEGCLRRISEFQTSSYAAKSPSRLYGRPDRPTSYSLLMMSKSSSKLNRTGQPKPTKPQR